MKEHTSLLWLPDLDHLWTVIHCCILFRLNVSGLCILSLLQNSVALWDMLDKIGFFKSEVDTSPSLELTTTVYHIWWVSELFILNDLTDCCLDPCIVWFLYRDPFWKIRIKMLFLAIKKEDTACGLTQQCVCVFCCCCCYHTVCPQLSSYLNQRHTIKYPPQLFRISPTST